MSKTLEYSIEMLNQYLATALWTEELDDLSIHDFSVPTKAVATEELKHFMLLAGSFLEGSPATPSNIGHDFWLSRSSHGAGFWDRPELYGTQGGVLTELAGTYRSAHVFIDDHGVPYIEVG